MALLAAFSCRGSGRIGRIEGTDWEDAFWTRSTLTIQGDQGRTLGPFLSACSFLPLAFVLYTAYSRENESI